MSNVMPSWETQSSLHPSICILHFGPFIWQFDTPYHVPPYLKQFPSGL